MRVTHLELSDFRNYESASIALEPGFNVILGRNGQGKTNLVEAVTYFSSLKSHRTSVDSALVRSGAESAIARMKVRALDREVLLELLLPASGAKRAQVNRHSVKPRELSRWFSSVLFAPEDLSILRGDPSGRRRFLDDAIVLRNPVFAGVIADYDRVVRQRTSLLKSARSVKSLSSLDGTLAVWDEQLVRLGVQIVIERRRLVGDLSPLLHGAYEILVESDHAPRLILEETVIDAPRNVSRETEVALLGVDVSRETLEREFWDRLAEVKSLELERGVTLIGPHRDDVRCELNGLPVKGYASHGETWSFALSLKLSLAQLVRDESATGDPVIILDDVFAELDARRRERLLHAIEEFEQVIVTAAVEEDLPRETKANVIRVKSGQAVRGEWRD